MSEVVTPQSASEAAAALAGAAAQRRAVRIIGGATKLGWGGVVDADALRIQTTHLSRVLVHNNQPDTATLSAGTPLGEAHKQLARHGKMLAIDPQLGLGQRPAATIGGVVATADGGPLAHAYGAARNQILGVSIALSDGTVVQTGPRSKTTQRGYDLAKLMTGSFGTLGILLSVDVRLYPLPAQTATALGSTDDPQLLARAVSRLAHSVHGLQAFDVAWGDGRGGILAQMAGATAEADATTIANAMVAQGLGTTAVWADDSSIWPRQRAGQRSADRAVIRIHAKRSQLAEILQLADDARADVVGRAALGITYLTLNVNRIAPLRARLPRGAGAVVLDLPQSARGAVDAWGVPEGPEIELMRQIKAQLDPAGICNPGIFVGTI